MDILSSILGTVTEYLIQPVVQQIGYIFIYKSNITSLEEESERLKVIRVDVERKVEADRRNNHAMASIVAAWLKRVTATTADVERVRQRRAEVERGCFYSLCPNLKSRYSVSKRSKKIAVDAIKLQTEAERGRYYDTSYHVQPKVEIDATPSKSDEEFESRKLNEEEVMTALRDERVTIIGICGMGGVGKTTLAKKIKERVKLEKLFDEDTMATVTHTPDLKKIQGEIAGGIGLTLKGDSVWSRKGELHERLTGKDSVFVILDDVWEALDLEELGIPSSSNRNHRCKVMVTTRRRDVCEAMEAQKIVEIGILTEKEAWSLFRHKNGNSLNDPSLIHIARDVAEECKGLPLAIVTVAVALKCKRKPSWEDARTQLRRAAPINISGMDGNVYQPLKLSYRLLESDELRYLFLLCSLFEEDSPISPKDLLNYGMGLDMFSKVKDLEEARKRVFHLLETLTDCFLLTKDRNIRRTDIVKMHDVVRDVAISIASEGKHVFMVSHDVNSEVCPRRTSYEQYSHISVVAKRFDELPEPIVCPRLEFLMLKLSETPIKLQDNFLKKMTELKVLSVSGHELKSSILPLPASVGCLRNLRTLSLEFVSLGDISIIGELLNLKILSFREAYFEVLPPEIGKLVNLIKLEVLNRRPLAIERIALGVLSRLVRLQELCLNIDNISSDSILRELQCLT